MSKIPAEQQNWLRKIDPKESYANVEAAQHGDEDIDLTPT